MKTYTLRSLGSFLFALLSAVFLVPGCEDSSCPDDENAAVESFPFQNDQDAWVQAVDQDKTTVNLVVENQQDYEKFVGFGGGKSRPPIDFSQFVLLAGRTITPECSFVGSQVVLNKCGTYTFEVTLEPKDCHALTTNYYFIIIYKTEHPIDFHIIQ